jgi:hypothetical protein
MPNGESVTRLRQSSITHAPFRHAHDPPRNRAREVATVTRIGLLMRAASPSKP